MTSEVLKCALKLLLGFLCCSISLGRDYCLDRFRNCICTDEDTECHWERTLHDMSLLVPYVRSGAKRVVVTESYVWELRADVLDSCKPNSTISRRPRLTELDLSNNHIVQIHRDAFTCMPNLEELNLSNNDWLVDSGASGASSGASEGHFKHLPNLKQLDLANAFSTNVKNWTVEMNLSSVFENMITRKLEVLVLSHNELTTLPPKWVDSICSMTSLKALDLSHNKLLTPGVLSSATGQCLESLEYLDLSFNQIPRFPKEFLENVGLMENLKSLNLGHNYYECNCLFLETFVWIHETELVTNHDTVACAGGNSSLTGKSLMSLHREELCPSVIETSRTDTTTGQRSSTKMSYQDCQQMVVKHNDPDAAVDDNSFDPTLVKCSSPVSALSCAGIHVKSLVLLVVSGVVIMI